MLFGHMMDFALIPTSCKGGPMTHETCSPTQQLFFWLVLTGVGDLGLWAPLDLLLQALTPSCAHLGLTILAFDLFVLRKREGHMTCYIMCLHHQSVLHHQRMTSFECLKGIKGHMFGGNRGVLSWPWWGILVTHWFGGESEISPLKGWSKPGSSLLSLWGRFGKWGFDHPWGRLISDSLTKPVGDNFIMIMLQFHHSNGLIFHEKLGTELLVYNPRFYYLGLENGGKTTSQSQWSCYVTWP